MTVVFESETRGAGTHMLVLGVDNDPTHNRPFMSSASKAATAVATWFANNSESEIAPLSSLEILASASDSIYAKFEVDNRRLDVRSPTAQTVQASLNDWVERLNTHTDNLAIFYFCGSATTVREDLVLYLDDDLTGSRSSAGANAIGLKTLTEALSRCRAKRQIFLIDAYDVSVISGISYVPIGLVTPPTSVSSLSVDPLRGVIVEVNNGEMVPSTVAFPPFTSVLIDMLDDARNAREALTVAQIVERIQRRPRSAGDTNIPFPDIVMRGDGSISIYTPTQPSSAAAIEFSEFPNVDPQIVHAESPEGNTEFVMDDAEFDRDELGRSVLAIGLARRLHRIWRQTNVSSRRQLDDKDSSFVVHIDAPWGGGKTTFANFVERSLNPKQSDNPQNFLRKRYATGDLGGIFIEDPPATAEDVRRLSELDENARRPWIVVNFNAWQAEHCSPPWWVFYQTLRQKCFDAVLKEGTEPWRPNRAPAKKCDTVRKIAHWIYLWSTEYWWRLANPKIRTLLGTALISGLLFLLMEFSGVWGTTADGNKLQVGYTLSNGIGLLLAGLTGGSAIWGIGAIITESVVPGTDTLSERLSLGNGDPFGRFRRHFNHSMARLKRPVLVVIDDLDRCKPSFVVDLVRGLQTLLRSPRVIFLVLGDRDWIERAFESQHSDMSQIQVGSEQTFGARFVEKAIQMSFVLPTPDKEDRLRYVMGVMTGSRARKTGQTHPKNADLAASVRTFTNRQTSANPQSSLEVATLIEQAVTSGEVNRSKGNLTSAEFETVVAQAVNEAVAINAAVSDQVETLIAHELEILTPYFPANPRQIKRIVNAITIYWAVALQRPGINADAAFRLQLAIWVILMTEWPKTWRNLLSCPEILDVVFAVDAASAVDGLTRSALLDSKETTLETVQRIQADSALVSLLGAQNEQSSRILSVSSVQLLADLTPIYARRR